jgi:hypothetical protein
LEEGRVIHDSEAEALPTAASYARPIGMLQ